MNTTLLRRILLVASIGLFSQFALAQDNPNATAVKKIADIVVGLSHFPSEADLATLDEIMGNDELAQGIRDMANTVANIEHSANEEGKGAMEAIQADAQVPERAKVLAGIIANFSHGASDDAKNQLVQLYP